MSPPNIIQFNASNVPVVQVTLDSKTRPDPSLFTINYERVLQ